MKVVLLAGGFGTRISEESHLKPKPMIEIGGKPIIWHIMKTYAYYGFNEFIICGGYKQDYIKDWFASYALWNSDVTFDFTKTESKVTIHNNACDPFKVTILDTGLYTMTGGRIKRTKDYVGDEPFFLTYGDGVSDVDIPATLEFHKACELPNALIQMEQAKDNDANQRIGGGEQQPRREIVVGNFGVLTIESEPQGKKVSKAHGDQIICHQEQISFTQASRLQREKYSIFIFQFLRIGLYLLVLFHWFLPTVSHLDRPKPYISGRPSDVFLAFFQKKQEGEYARYGNLL